MTIKEIIDYLLVRLEDTPKDAYNSMELVAAVNNAIVRVANEIHPAYLTELETLQTNVSVTGGKIDLSSGLSNKVLQGGEGIRKVVVTNGPEIKKINVDKTKSLENVFRQATLKEPVWFPYANNIHIRPTAVTNVEVWYLRTPKPLLYEFSMAAHSTNKTTMFIGATDEGLSEEDDAYNGTTDKERAVIYCKGKKSYHVVTDYAATGGAGGTPLFTVSPAADTDFGTDVFYFCSHSFDQLNLDGLTFELNEGLRNLVLDFAEAECRGMEDEQERKKSVLTTAMAELELLNAKYRESRLGDKSGR